MTGTTNHGHPTGWALTVLGEPLSWGSGGTPLRSRAEYYDGDIPWAIIGDLADGPVVETSSRITELGLRASAAKWVQPGSILLAMYGSIGKLGINSIPLTTNQAIAFTNPEPLNAKYLFYYLMSVRSDLISKGKGGTQSNISQTVIKGFPFIVAPLPEQHRIVSAIESYFTRLDDAVATLKRVQRNLKRYRASVLKAAVEGRLVPTEAELARAEGRTYEPASVLLERILAERHRAWEEAELAKMKAKGKAPKDDRWKAKYVEPVAPVTNELPGLPEGWCWASLESITSAVRVICYGILMPKDHVPDGVPYVKVRDMRSGLLNVPSLQRTAPEIAAKYARASLMEGDLLLAIRGTYGRVVDVPPDLEGGNITQDTARLAVASEVEVRYLKALLLSPSVQGFFKRVARGVAVKGVNIADVRATPIALPPALEQRRIAQEVEDQLSLVDAAEVIVNLNGCRLTRLRQSILKWAFEGRLVDQDPTDEPASALLERIRAERSSASDKPARRPRRAKARTPKS